VSADSRGEAAPVPRDGASRLKFGTGRSPSLQQVFRRKLPLLFSARESSFGEGVSQKFVTGVRIQGSAAACMFKFNPRGRVLVRPMESALPGIVPAAPIVRSARTLRSHWRADRRVGRLSRRSRPYPRDGASRLKFGTGRSPSLQQGRGRGSVKNS